MSSFSRRAFGLALVGGLGACGFSPLYGGGEAGLASVSIQEAVDPETYAFRERMRRRIGHQAGDSADFSIVYAIDMVETPVAINPASDVTRYQLDGTVRWRLTPSVDGRSALEGEVRTVGGYDATGAPFAARAAQRDERARLAEELAELTATRILAALRRGS